MPGVAANGLMCNLEDGKAILGAQLERVANKAKEDPVLSLLVTDLEALVEHVHKDLRLGSSTFVTLKGCIATLLQKLAQQDAHIAQHRKDIDDLKARVHQLRAQVGSMEQDRRKVLLGQLAYTLDLVVCEYVKGPGAFCTIMVIDNLYENDLLGPDETRQYSKFREFVQKKGFNIQRLIASTKPVRFFRFTSAQCTAEEQASTTLEDVRAWAAEFKVSEPAFEMLIGFLQEVTAVQRPLIRCQDINSMIQ